MEKHKLKKMYLVVKDNRTDKGSSAPVYLEYDVDEFNKEQLKWAIGNEDNVMIYEIKNKIK